MSSIENVTDIISGMIKEHGSEEGFLAGYHAGAAFIVTHFAEVASLEDDPYTIGVIRRECVSVSEMFLDLAKKDK